MILAALVKSPHVLFRYGQAPTPLPPAEPATAEGNKSRSIIHADFRESDVYSY